MRRHRDEVRAELGIEPNEIVFGTVANFRREKAYEVLLEAARLAAEVRSTRSASSPWVRVRSKTRCGRSTRVSGWATVSSCSATARMPSAS